MKRLLVLAGVLALGALAVDRGARAQGDKDADTVKKIMQKTLGRGQTLKPRFEKAVKGKDWAAASKAAKEWLNYAKKLPDLKPPVGDVDDYKKDAKAFVKLVTELSEGADKKDADAVKDVMGKINQSCGQCHDNYRKKKKG